MNQDRPDHSTNAQPAGATLADQRKDYSRASLSEDDVAADPLLQFSRWFEQAQAAQLAEPNAMSLATVGADGRPSSRIVLIKQFGADGFTWYTSYASRKAAQLESRSPDGRLAHPFAALLFHWVELERQVRIEGRVERVPAQQSDAYFHSRPLASRLGAIASRQSSGVANRATLEQQYAQAQERSGDHPQRPSDWGGYRLVPDYFEFWQGRRSRLHDRISYARQADGHWDRQRLQP
ncbi:MAG: pyridoxamine 5'-phosphate oxidase [Janthinobacterium lividum]